MHKFVRVCIITVGLLLGTTVTSQAQPSPAPRVWSMTVVEDTHTDDSVSFRVTFSEPVSGVDVSDFSIAGDTQNPRIANVSTSDRTDSFTVEVTFQSPGTKLALALLDDDSIVNAAQIPLGGIGAQNGNAISPAAIPSILVKTSTTLSSPQAADLNAPKSSTHTVGTHISLALTSANIPVISYYDETFKDLKLAICTDAVCNNPSISTIDSAFFVGEYVSLKLTSNNIPVISYLDSTKDDLKLAICNNTACTSPTIKTIDSTGVVGLYSSLALTSSDIPIISYYDATNNNLKLAVCNNATCTSPTTKIVDYWDDVGMYSSLALTSTGIPIISYYDSTRYNLKLAICDNTACTSPLIHTIDTGGNVGAHTSLALTSTDLPVISYDDATNLSMKLLVCSDATCTTDTETTIARTGGSSYSAITVDWRDTPVISYYSVTDQDVKLATCYDTVCTIPDIFTVGYDTYSGPVTKPVALALVSSRIPIVAYSDDFNLALHHGSMTIDQGQPNSFAKSSPTVGQRITTSSATLAWAASTYAASYEYCYATSIATCTTWINTGTTRTSTITGLAHDTTYYWQVRAVNTSGTRTADGGTMHNFTVTMPPAAFAKSAPANNDVNRPTRQTLTWEASTRASSYEYCIALTTAACTNWITTGAVRSVTVPSLAKNKAYYWQVRAKNSAGTTLSSSTFWKFTTAP